MFCRFYSGWMWFVEISWFLMSGAIIISLGIDRCLVAQLAQYPYPTAPPMFEQAVATGGQTPDSNITYSRSSGKLFWILPLTSTKKSFCVVFTQITLYLLSVYLFCVTGYFFFQIYFLCTVSCIFCIYNQMYFMKQSNKDYLWFL